MPDHSPRNHHRPWLLALLLVLIPVYAGSSGCSSGGGAGDVPALTVTLQPQNVSLNSGGTQAFTAAVTGSSNTAVSWSVAEGDTGGSITPSGVYTAPAHQGIYHVVASSQADGSKTAAAEITVTTNASITIAPPSATIPINGTQSFSASVSGLAGGVKWSVKEGAAGGSIDSQGVYTAPATAGLNHVIATSQLDPSITDIAGVNVHITLTITPPSATISVGDSYPFTAVVGGTSNTAVSWSVQPGGGSITQAGIYTAPAAPGTYYVTATSQLDPTQQAVVPVTVQAGGAQVTVQ